jgi:ABC-2 type transport system ATP-binding protein
VPEPSSDAAIRTVRLAKHFDRIAALRGLSMTVRRGEVFGFLGPNGAGKTTAVKLLLGLTRPTSGEAWVLGAPAGDLQTRRRIGYLPELFRYQDWLSAREVLGVHATLAHVPPSERRRAIDRVLDDVGLRARANDRVGTFSKGMQQRLGLAVALVGKPELVFLDEPTSALDPVGRQDVRGIIERLKAQGTTVFLNSHLLTEVERVCDRVAIVHDGLVVSEGAIETLVRGSGVRVRLAELTAEVATVTRHNGWTSRMADGELLIEGIADDDIPALISALVGAGARIYAVDRVRATLEERFLQLLQGDEPADDRFAHPA